MTTPADSQCSHLDQIGDFPSDQTVCPQCEVMGDRWVHLRQCLVCGQVGCCDSSKNCHATKHFHASGHSLLRSLQPGESWIWCYADQTAITDHPAGKNQKR